METTKPNFFVQNRRWLIALAIPVLIGIWAAFRPELLFVNKTVNESLPPATAITAAATNSPENVREGKNAAATAEPRTLLTGEFSSLAHQTKGTATVLELGGKKYLRFTNFVTSNGPDVRVYLVAGNDGKDNKTINAGNIIDLGTIKGNQGDQNYELPADFDTAKYRGVSIWCKRFAVNFGAANLNEKG